MTGNIWMCSHLLDTDDLEFGKHEFITYKMGQEYYGIPLIGYSLRIREMIQAISLFS